LVGNAACYVDCHCDGSEAACYVCRESIVSAQKTSPTTNAISADPTTKHRLEVAAGAGSGRQVGVPAGFVHADSARERRIHPVLPRMPDDISFDLLALRYMPRNAGENLSSGTRAGDRGALTDPDS
jgi:hypothetical protein